MFGRTPLQREAVILTPGSVQASTSMVFELPLLSDARLRESTIPVIASQLDARPKPAAIFGSSQLRV